MANKIYLDKEFDKFWKKIEKKENFVLLRYGDGERAIMCGKKVRAQEGWESPDYVSKLGKALLDTLHEDDERVFYGISCPCCDQQAYFWYYTRINNKNKTFANLWANVNYQNFITKFDGLKRDAILIANHNARGKKIGNLNILKHYEVGDDCMSFWEHDAENLIKQIKKDFGSKNNLLYVVSAGPMSEPIIMELFHNNPNNCYIDFGSSIDKYIHDKQTRPYMDPSTKYAKRLCCMDNPKTVNFDVSVVLSAYKRIQNLPMQLDAIEKQTVKPREILLFQDGVADGTKIVIPNDIKKRFNIVEISKTNQGVWARFDFARKKATSQYVCIFDDDTIPGHRWLENCVVAMNKQEGLYGTIGILCNTDAYVSGSHIRIGWANPKDNTHMVDFVGHSWFLKTKWLNYLFNKTEDLQAYKICGEDMTLSQKLQEHNIATFVPPHPQNDTSLWGSLPEYSNKFGNDQASLFVNNGWSKMSEAFDLLLHKYNFKLVKDTHPVEYAAAIEGKKSLLKKIFSVRYETLNNVTTKVITLCGLNIRLTQRPLYKNVYHWTVKPMLSIISLRYIRKKIKKYRKERALRTTILAMIRDIEKDFSDNTVLIFQHQFYDFMGKQCYNGGAERYVQDLADILHKNKYQPVLIQLSFNGLWVKKIGKLSIVGIPADDVDEYQNIIKLFTKYKFVIYSGAVHWGKKLHPNILISHGITWDAPGNNVDTRKIESIFKDVDKFISVDTNTISWLRTTFSKTMKNLDANYIPNYVDTSIYVPTKRKKDGKIHITFPRRASPERGYWLMSAALPPILDKYPNVMFQFVGFAHGTEIQHDILGLEKRYPGRVSHCMVEPNKMPEIYQNTDISLVPTMFAEGTSLSCLEAQACGNIVISTNIGGLPNLIIDGYNGLLINPTGQDLMKTLDRVLHDKNLQKTLSQNAVSVASAFDKSIWIERWNRVICNYKPHKG